MNFDDLLPKESQQPAGTIYLYGDGNANLYFVTKEFIEYAPMSPKFSNTGEYSGGEPLKVALKETDLEVLKVVFELAAEKVEDHISNRLKGSGILSFEEEGKSYNLAINSISQKAVELVLNQLLGK